VSRCAASTRRSFSPDQSARPAIRPPEGVDQDVVGRTRIADDAQDPAVHVALEFPEELLEGRLIALDKPGEDFDVWPTRHVVYLVLLRDGEKGSRQAR
jgi:hypothetical protein